MNGLEKIVHLIPLGFEIDRVIKPLKKYPVSRAHIFTIDSEKHGHELYEKQKHYTEKVKKGLEELGIEYRVHDTDIFDLLRTIEKTREVIKTEREKGSRLYVNVSAAGRLTAVASTLTSMYHDLQTYYVKADRYAKDKERKEHGLSVVEEPRIKDLENFRFEEITQEEITVLKALDKDGSLKTDQIINKLRQKFDKFYYKGNYKNLDREEKQKLLMKLNRGVLDKLENKKYIKRQKTGRRNIIELTESGEYMAKIS